MKAFNSTVFFRFRRRYLPYEHRDDMSDSSQASLSALCFSTTRNVERTPETTLVPAPLHLKLHDLSQYWDFYQQRNFACLLASPCNAKKCIRYELSEINIYKINKTCWEKRKQKKPQRKKMWQNWMFCWKTLLFLKYPLKKCGILFHAISTEVLPVDSIQAFSS